MSALRRCSATPLIWVLDMSMATFLIWPGAAPWAVISERNLNPRIGTAEETEKHGTRTSYTDSLAPSEEDSEIVWVVRATI